MFTVNWDDLDQNPSLVLPALPEEQKTALTIGVFDGIHLGHQALIGRVVKKAPNLVPAVVTFRKNLKGRPILTFEEKVALFGKMGAALALVIDFSPEFSTMNGRAFFCRLRRFLRPAYIAVGENFHCGYGRGTDARAFKALGEESGVEVEIVPPVLEGGLPVSSSRIRALLRAGKTDEAELLLGRPLRF